VQEQGLKLYSKHFLLIALGSAAENSRVGITITTKVDKRATERNRLKRRIREIFRLNSKNLKENFDIVVIARKNAVTCDYPQIEREILGALKHHGLLKT